MVPLPHFAKRCDQEFVVGERYRMEVREESSTASRNFYFASLAEAWENLLEEDAQRFPSPDHLRKWALVKAGFCNQRTIVAASKAEAIRTSAVVRELDEFAVVTVHDEVVTVYTARSQRVHAMGREDFERSKRAVLEIVSGMIGVKESALESNAGTAA